MASEPVAGDVGAGTGRVPVLTRGSPTSDRRSPAVRRLGYVVAIVVNGVMWYLVHQLPDWEWARFLTPDFDELLPWIDRSLGATIVANTLFLAYDPRWFRSAGNVITTAISLAVAIRTLQVFPFDFSGYDLDWSWLVRMIVIVAIVGTAIGLVAEVVRLIRIVASGSVGRAGSRAS